MSLEKLLAKNMQRFGTKNLNETQNGRITQLMLEQINTYEEPDPYTDNYLQRNVPAAEWQIDGFTAPEINNMSDSGKTSFKDAYRTYMDLANGMVGKTLIVFKNATSIDNCVFDPKNVYLRIVIQSSYVPGPKAKDVAATGIMGQESYIKIWETKQATRNFELATKTAVLKLEDNPRAGVKQASISLVLDKAADISDPAGGFVSAAGEYSIGMDYSVRRGGAVIGYCPINFSGDSVHKTEGWGTVLVSGGYPTANSW